MNKKSENLEISRSLTSSILESITDGVFTVDADWHITSFNHAAEQITGVKRQQAKDVAMSSGQACVRKIVRCEKRSKVKGQ
jgi:PAS domain S-box-containing protein